MTHPFYLQDPEALRALAHDLFDSVYRQTKHWSVKATVLGRLTDERLYERWGYDSPEQWVSEQLDLTRGEFRLALKLWRLMRKGHAAGVEPEGWCGVSKGKALLLCEVLEAGGEPKTWCERATTMDGTAFQVEVDRHLERQTWVTFTARVPAEVRDLIRDACQRALPYVVQDPAVDLKGWNQPEHLFRCLELVAMQFVRDTPVMMEGTEEAL